MYEPGVIVRPPREGEEEALARLILRFYLFNEEFDPAWAITDKPEEAALERARAYIAGEGETLVAVVDGRIAGYLHLEVRENPMLAAKKIGVITELYVEPSMRGRGIATLLVDEAEKMLERKGVPHIAAEFPSKNYVAERFYTKKKFRPYTSIYLREV